LVIKIRGSGGSTGMGGEVGEVCRTGNEGGLRCDYGAPPPLHYVSTQPAKLRLWRRFGRFVKASW